MGFNDMQPWLVGALASGSIVLNLFVLHKLSSLIEHIRTTKPNKPEYIVLVRHGESEGNVDHTKYASIGDPNICLTEDGVGQAISAGRKLREMFKNHKVFCYVSPYFRTKQTADFILSQLPEKTVCKKIFDPRIREREFSGSFQPLDGLDRMDEHSYSRFFWRPSCGESCADVYDRISLFIDTLWRDFKRHPEMEGSAVLLVSHGLTTRLFLMRWLHWSIDQFNATMNPTNCGIMVLRRVTTPEDDYYELTEESMKQLGIAKSFAQMKLDTVSELNKVPTITDVVQTFDIERKQSERLISLSPASRRGSRKSDCGSIGTGYSSEVLPYPDLPTLDELKMDPYLTD